MSDDKPRPDVRPNLPEAVIEIASKCDPARLMELYYWSQEPGLLEIVRAVGAMPQSDRDALVATWEASGRLPVESSDLYEALKVVSYLMEDPPLAARESGEKKVSTDTLETQPLDPSGGYRSYLHEIDEYINKNGRPLTSQEQDELYDSIGGSLR